MKDDLNEKRGEIVRTRWNQIKNSTFDVFVKIVKHRETDYFKATILMFFCFTQICGTIITNYKYIDWKDNIVGYSIVEFFKIIRITPIIIQYNSVLLYWLTFGTCNLKNNYSFITNSCNYLVFHFFNSCYYKKIRKF